MMTSFWTVRHFPTRLEDGFGPAPEGSVRRFGEPAPVTRTKPDEADPGAAFELAALEEPSAEEMEDILDAIAVSDKEPEAGQEPSPSIFPERSVAGPAIKLFDPASVYVAGGGDENPFEEGGGERGALLKAMATDAATGYRALVVPQAQQVAALHALEATAPQLASVISIVADAAEAALRQAVGFACPPLLIAGPPGVGKTRLIRMSDDSVQQETLQ